jgi:hypothetical protein
MRLLAGHSLTLGRIVTSERVTLTVLKRYALAEFLVISFVYLGGDNDEMAVSLELPSDFLTEIIDAVLLRIQEQQGWVTIEGLAERMGCDVARIYHLREKGLPGRKIAPDGTPSKRLYFFLPEVWAWLEAESVRV